MTLKGVRQKRKRPPSSREHGKKSLHYSSSVLYTRTASLSIATGKEGKGLGRPALRLKLVRSKKKLTRRDQATRHFRGFHSRSIGETFGE